MIAQLTALSAVFFCDSIEKVLPKEYIVNERKEKYEKHT